MIIKLAELSELIKLIQIRDYKLTESPNTKNNCYISMEIPNIIQLLQSTLNPSLIHQAQSTLLNERQRQGFITNLLIISDDPQYNILIRQSALVYIKNALIDDYNKTINLPDNDFQTVKSSILQALIRNCQQKSITPTIKELIYVLAEHQFPQNWPEIIPQIANNIQNSGDFNQIFGSIEALKAIVSAIVAKVDCTVTLENVCNKIVLPLLSLASKLFQNYNDTTSFILISIFKIFSTITNFQISQIVILNMHSWMIFVKKLLDLNIEAGNIDMNMYQLKKICLRIMFRFYQRHLNRKFFIAGKNVIDEFHQKFTKGITESLLLQIINEAQLTKNSTNKNYIKLTKYSLACLSYVYEQDRNSALIIDRYREKIIYMCLERYKTKINKAYSSYGEFASKLNEQRAHLCQFIRALIKNKTKAEQEVAKGNYNYNNLPEAIAMLACLYGFIQKGDMEMKELCLYIYSDIASSLPENDPEIQSKMLTFILNIVKPLLSTQDTSTIIKLRCCEILSKYSYIQIPESELTQIGGGVYGCLISSSNHPDSASMDTFLQIHSVYAFNSLLRYDFIINFTSSYLSNILQVYTSLLQIEVSMLKCLEDMLAKFEYYLQPFGNDLIEMLTQMFFKYHEMVTKYKGEPLQSVSKNQKQDEEEYDSDEEEGNQNSDNNYLNASKACLGAIRQIIQVPQFVFQKDELIHNLLISIFSDRQMLYTQEGFNILNQILFKAKTLKSEYNIYFSLIIFGIIPINESYINILKSENSSYSNTLLTMLECQCSDPDPDFLQNTIGCLRNFISKYQQNLRNQVEKSGVSFLDLILNAVKYVHENQSSKANQTQRSIILTLYISLIEWNAINDEEMKQILQNVGNWINMQKELCENSQANTSMPKNNFQQKVYLKEGNKKTLYCPIYMQIILLACHFYPKVTLNVLNGSWISGQLLLNWDRFHIDYELSRLLIGVADLFSFQSISDQNICSQILNRLPDIIEKVSKIRLGEYGDHLESQDEEAEEEKYFGMDENTHIMGWNKQNIARKPNQNQEEMDDQDSPDQDEEDDEFNKYYESPLDSIDQIAYIANVLRNPQCQTYMSLMRNDNQQKMSFLILNAPSKFSDDKNC